MFRFLNIFLNKLGYELIFRRYKGVSPSYEIKRATIISYAKNYQLDTLVETGTYLGDTVKALMPYFRKIISIELDQELYERAQFRFRRAKNVLLVRGDSSDKLPGVMKRIDKPVIFWLDGHYSGDISAKGALKTPIRKELETILSHKIKNHVVLIDDARDFSGRNDYPTVRAIKDIVETNSNYDFSVENDIMRIVPK